MRGALVPILFVVLIGAVAGLLFLLRGDPEPRPSDGDGDPSAEPHLPAFVPEADRAAVAGLRLRIRDALGRDAEAFVKLSRHTPSDPDYRVEWLRFFRPEVDLAIRSGDAGAGSAALEFIGASLGDSGSPARSLVDGPAYRDTWIRALESETQELRLAAVRLLGRLGGEPNRARVAGSLDDSSAEVRVAAVDVYVLLGGRTSRLASRYAGEKDARVRLAILMAFAEGRAPRDAGVLEIEAAALAGGSDMERMQAMRNLARHRDQDLLEAVLGNLRSPSKAVRKCALDTLARLRDRRAVEKLRIYAKRESEPDLGALALKVADDLE